MSFPSALVDKTGRMPIVLELLFLVLAIVLLLTSSAVSWRYLREWRKNRDRRSRTPFRLPPAKNSEVSLYIVGALICTAVAMPAWGFRALFGGGALIGLLLTIRRLNAGSKSAPNFDQASVLHAQPTDTHATTLSS
jgi:hypothetical protein